MREKYEYFDEILRAKKEGKKARNKETMGKSGREKEKGRRKIR
jgi:hypothetical protein